MMSAAAGLPRTRPPLPFNPQHRDIFDLMTLVANRCCPDVVLRVSGGWVRDNLLGRLNHDIDFAIESAPGRDLVTGAIFAQHVANVVAEVRPDIATSSMSVIRTNPDKSKHLETAQLTVLGIPLEFCHLRQDDYTSTSRVPTVRVATPHEDALRRDFTVNALFYNLSTQCIEDWTTGLSDLERRVLRCPLDPFETFKDDPLRLLRAIRFSAQLEFELDSTIVNCMMPTSATASHPILTGLLEKVSHERWGIELTKMFSGRDPSRALAALYRLGVWNTVILNECYCPLKGKRVPDLMVPSLKCFTGDYAAMMAMSERLLRITSNLTSVRVGADPVDAFSEGSSNRHALSWAAALLPVMQSPPPAPERLVGRPDFADVMTQRIEAILVHNVKLPTNVSDLTASFIKHAVNLLPQIPTLLQCAERNEPIVGPTRLVVFQCIKAFKSSIPMQVWQAALTLSVALSMTSSEPQAVLAATGQIVDLLMREAHIVALAVAPPIVRGDELVKELNFDRKLTSQVLDSIQEFVLHNPGVNRDAVLAHARTWLSQRTA